ncbi:ATP-dependent nuclease [Paenibacillus sp. IHBB 10380]|uniref:ATP-dependent nuclease n=1 Tax=Paenibacillus sp. IHBB 10380 TaxID=1566358 RepID=UPI0005CFDB7F|nr:AAA family ATPase [Paenibacillus sp. IHBB 10380]AJS58269.1 DNA helicase [Paenibacillus sp. IHBB 10380]
MQISKLCLKNFRSFGDSGTTISLNKLSGFVGENSSGKTALIHGLVKLFGVSSHDRALEKSDFHIPVQTTIESIKEHWLSIEARIDFPELVDSSGDSQSKNSLPPFFNQLVVRSTAEAPYLRVRLIAKWTAGNTPEGEIEQKLYFVTVAEGIDESDEDLVPVTPHQRSAIQVIYVPAVREPSIQLKNASGTILWRILNNISWPDDIDDTIKIKMEPVNELFDGIDGVAQIRSVIGEEWKKYHKDVRYQDAKLQFNSSTLASILKKIEVSFSPTHDLGEYSVDKLGDGLRSLFYLSLVSSLLEAEIKITGKSNASLTLLAVEEPENHISPHLLGRVMENLKDISKKENAQVVLTSHSASIIKRVDPENLAHLRIDQTSFTTIVKKIVLPSKTSDAYTYIKEAVRAYPEIYFSRLVILGEGDSEEIVIPRILEINELYPDDYGISIVPLGGRHVNHMWKLLNELDIPHITLLDLDRERGGGGWGRIKYAINQLLLNGRVRDELLTVWYPEGDGFREDILTENQLEIFEKNPMTPEWIKSMNDFWLPRLMEDKYNVFYSAPLDLDFLMLETFPDAYKKTVPRGPSIPSRADDLQNYNKKIKGGIIAALKNEKSTGYTYTEKQHELMVWYNTLFLGRSKPSTHIEALLKIDDDDLLIFMPEVFTKLVERVKELLERNV